VNPLELYVFKRCGLEPAHFLNQVEDVYLAEYAQVQRESTSYDPKEEASFEAFFLILLAVEGVPACWLAVVNHALILGELVKLVNLVVVLCNDPLDQEKVDKQGQPCDRWRKHKQVAGQLKLLLFIHNEEHWEYDKE